MELGIERIREAANREAAPGLDEIGYRVDDLVIDVRRHSVARGNETIALSPLSYELLLTLLRAAPNLVSLDELMQRVWPDVVVGPETVSQRVKLVRQALGDNAGSPRYIAGVRGRGYRLIGTVQAMDPADAPCPAAIKAPFPSIGSGMPGAHPAQPGETSASRRPRAQLLRRVLYSTLALLVAAVLIYEIIADESQRDWLVVQPPAPAAEPSENSLAVLPFVNLGGDPASGHFSDGLSEEILNRLSRSEGLRVLARTSSFAYEGSGLDARELRDLLGVRYLLEGTVRRDGRYVRVTAQLVDESGFRVWTGSWDREITDTLAAQDEIAASMARSILPRVSAVPEEEIHRGERRGNAKDRRRGGSGARGDARDAVAATEPRAGACRSGFSPAGVPCGTAGAASRRPAY